MSTRKDEVWLAFATALVAKNGCPNPQAAAHITHASDILTDEWDHRFGDAAFLLGGQSECGACHRPISGDNFKASVDGVKFCNDACLKGSGRDE